MKILAIAYKDLTRSFRSTFSVGMMVVVPLLLIGLIYFAFGGGTGENSDLPSVQVGIVNLDILPPGAPLDQSLGSTIRDMFFDESVASWITTSEYLDETSARAALDNQEIGVAVILPQDLTRRVLAGEIGSSVLVLSDPTLTVAPQVVENMVLSMLNGVSGGGIAVQVVMERQQANDQQSEPKQVPGIIEQYATWYTTFQRDLFHNPDRAALIMMPPSAKTASENTMERILRTMMAGQLVFFAFFTGSHSMMLTLREDEEGTLARLFTTPVSRTAILSGKFLAVFLSVVVQGIVMITATHFVFKMDWGELPAVALALTGQVIAAVGLGVLLMSLVKTTRQGGTVLGGGLTALGMLGGLFTVGMNMPKAFTMLSNLTPQGWVIKGWKIVLDGLPLSDLLVPFAVMTLTGFVMFAIGAKIFQKRYA